MITGIISTGVLLILLCCILLFFNFSHQRFSGEKPVSRFAFFAIIFTSGLDGGFILLPLIEYSSYQASADFSFTNPLALEIGFWGISVWLLYFVSTLYFCALEPKLKFFEKPWVKVSHSVVVLLTCAFTLSLFSQSAQHYLAPFSTNATPIWAHILVVFIVIFAISVSTKVKFMTWLSQISVVLFICLIITLALLSQYQWQDLQTSAVLITDYFMHLPNFILPFNDYHEFYLAWWFTWTIMLGQFVARFVNNMSPLSLLMTMVILPLIPTSIWFSLLYHWHELNISHNLLLNVFMVIVAMLFVVNSLDFMTANYSHALRLNIENFNASLLGKLGFVTLNTAILLTLTYLFQRKLLLVNYIAVLVITMIGVLVLTALKNKQHSMTKSY